MHDCDKVARLESRHTMFFTRLPGGRTGTSSHLRLCQISLPIHPIPPPPPLAPLPPPPPPIPPIIPSFERCEPPNGRERLDPCKDWSRTFSKVANLRTVPRSSPRKAPGKSLKWCTITEANGEATHLHLSQLGLSIIVHGARARLVHVGLLLVPTGIMQGP